MAGKFVNANAASGNLFDNYAYAAVKTASFPAQRGSRFGYFDSQ